MRGISKTASVEIGVRNSRFLAESFICESQESARATLRAQKEKYRDAAHVVHAFVIGPTGGILGCSDDGEPSGTAGRPVLDVLRGSGLTDAMITVTRWFGGTLLGTGGLVKAYGESAKAVIAATGQAELVAVRDFSVRLPYESHERLLRELPSLGATVSLEAFDSDVTVNGFVTEGARESFVARVIDLSKGRASVTLAPESRMGRLP